MSSQSLGINTQRKPAGASPGGECAGFVQSFVSGFFSKVAIACAKPIADIAHKPQKIHTFTSIKAVPPGAHFDCFSAAEVCDAEYLAARQSCNGHCPPGGLHSPDCAHLECVDVRPPPAHKSAGRLTAPLVVGQGRGTRNKLVWLQLRFELEDMAAKS